MDFEEGRHFPFKKPNNQILYVDKESNHPKTITTTLPGMINTRIQTLSSSKDIFDTYKKPYIEGFKNAGYSPDLIFSDNTDTVSKTQTKPNIRQRKSYGLTHPIRKM